jgi:MFS family permease
MRETLKVPGFKRLWLAQVVSILGDFLALFGVINLITFKWHGTPLQVTNVMIAYIIPMAIVGPLAGVFIDRWNVKRTMIASDLIRALLILCLVFVTRLEQIYVVFFLVSTVSSFFAPSQSVTLRALVPIHGLLSANALMSQAFYTMRIIAPAAAGLLVYWLGENSCFYLDTVSFIFSAAMLSTILIVRVVKARGSGEKTVGSMMKDYTAGSRFILTHPAISFVMIAMMTAMFVMSCFSPLISVYVRDQLHAGTRAFGLISAMVGVGLIAGTQLVNAIAKGFSKETRCVGWIIWTRLRDLHTRALPDRLAGGGKHVCPRLRHRLHCCPGADIDAAGDAPRNAWPREQQFHGSFFLVATAGTGTFGIACQLDRSATLVLFQRRAARGAIGGRLFVAARRQTTGKGSRDRVANCLTPSLGERKLEHRAGVEPAMRALQARALATWRPVLIELSNTLIERAGVTCVEARHAASLPSIILLTASACLGRRCA